VPANRAARQDWEQAMTAYGQAEPDPAAELRDALAGTLPRGWDASAPGDAVLEHYGFTADNVAGRARALLERLGRAGRGPLVDLPA
jgi:transketolase